MTTVHIHARDIVYHDAVGSFSQQTAMLLERNGYHVKLWAEHSNVNAPHPVGNRRGFEATLSPSDIIFFNHSIHDPALDSIISLPNRKLAYFHNVTPPELIDPADAATVKNCRLGLDECGRLAAFDSLLANSKFTAETLLNAMTPADADRFRNSIVICPPLIGADRWQGVEAVERTDTSSSLKGLFVGRLVTHKGVSEILDILSHLAAIRPDVELIIVGGPSDGAYVEMLREKAARSSENRPGFRARFLHGISDEELKAIYQNTSFCMAHSSHEGFCVPALDALSFDKPMFVTSLPAVLEVLGSAALVIPQHDQGAAATKIADYFGDEDTMVRHSALRRERLGQMIDLADGQLILEAVRKVESE
ncbi:glycosyltransferase family 4 protein [Rhizobium sp. CG4]|uniref:glycosyltransferase n=1 Tax=Rhizobium sp. CG4 TaxID=2726075 RepID=UPI002033FDDE|nr:glycosyltransferase [Rhizobium sp. CG4]MCM2458006.1 glycosyltransferase family 4 protein [Rhizobium sp. CG4]